MNLTAAINQDYDALVTAKSVAGIGILYEAAEAAVYAAFLRLVCPRIMGGLDRGRKTAGASPVCQPVQFPPTPDWHQEGGSFNELEAHIMTNIIPVVSRIFSGKPTQAVNAKKFYSFLSKSQSARFNDWIIRRISEYGFVEGEDYQIQRTKTKGRPSTDYFLTLDMAKELAMVERNEKGREARRYFIECEKQLRTKPQPKALPAPKKYNYPRKLLEQDGFIMPDRPARLNISMLGNKHFVSPLMHLLNELRVDGHDVSAAWDEAIALRDGVIRADEVLERISLEAIRGYSMPASTSFERKK